MQENTEEPPFTFDEDRVPRPSQAHFAGVRDLVAFALGDISRFASPAKLVKYIGLDPALDESGDGKWEGGIGRHGRKDLRSLLMEAPETHWPNGAEDFLHAKARVISLWPRLPAN